MNKRQAKSEKIVNPMPDSMLQKVVAPSFHGGADKEYTVVFEKKAIYRKPSFAR